MDSWNGLDFIIFLILAVNTLLGMSRAAAKEIISTICLCLALICTIKFTLPLAGFFNASPLAYKVVTSQYVQNFIASLGLTAITENTLHQIFYSISLLVCFVGVFSIGEGVLAMSGILEVYSFPYAWLNRKLGAALGAVRGYVIVLILISITVLHVFKDVNNPLFTGSTFVKLFYKSAERLDSIIYKQKPEEYHNIFKDKNLYNPVKALEEIAKPAMEGVVPSGMLPSSTQDADMMNKQ